MPPSQPDGGPHDDGYAEYGEGKAPLYEVEAVFYKTIVTVSRGSENEAPQPMQYPVVLAWQWDRVAEVGAFDGPPPSHYIIGALMLMGIIIGGALFFLLRKRTKKYRESGGMWQKYHALRDEQAAADSLEATPTDVDPDLAAAAQEYRKERGLDDKATHEATDEDKS
jgi:hypothetical protein